MDLSAAPMILEQATRSEISMKKKSDPVNPAQLMVAFWGFIFFVYFAGPIYLTPAISWVTLVFLLAHIGLFCCGVAFAKNHLLAKPVVPVVAITRFFQEQALRKVMLFTLCVGLFGCLAGIYCKLSSVGIMDFTALSKLRADRAQSLMHGEAGYSGILSALSFLTYPAGLVGIVATVIYYENMPRLFKVLSYLYMISLVLLSVCSAGRSAILVLFIMMGIAFYLRSKSGKRLIPRSVLIRVVGIALLLSFSAYSSHVWLVRSKESHFTSVKMMRHASRVWGAHPREYLLASSKWLGGERFTQTVLSSTFYFIQSPLITQRFLFANFDALSLWGAYQIDLVAGLFRLLPNEAALLKKGYSALNKSRVYGYFPGAWTGFFIDFGVLSYLIAGLWGFFVGRAWVNFKQKPNFFTTVPYVFWIYSIFISFVSGPFGFANSFMIFVWFSFLTLGTQLISQLMIAKNCTKTCDHALSYQN